MASSAPLYSMSTVVPDIVEVVGSSERAAIGNLSCSGSVLDRLTDSGVGGNQRFVSSECGASDMVESDVGPGGSGSGLPVGTMLWRETLVPVEGGGAWPTVRRQIVADEELKTACTSGI